MVALSAGASGRSDARRIEGRGTPEATWQAWGALDGLALRSAGELFPERRRVVVVAPHPDDELLGCGGTLAVLARLGREIVVVGVTDGEASHPRSTRFSPRASAASRCAERRSGLDALGLDGASRRLGLPDGGVGAAEDRLTRTLQALLVPDDIVLATWRFDGHPDREAAGRAAVAAATASGCVTHEMPIWMWHWAAPGNRRVPWRRLTRVPLDAEALERKRIAIGAHESPLSRDGDRDAILPDWALDRLRQPFDYFFASRRRRPRIGQPASST